MHPPREADLAQRLQSWYAQPVNSRMKRGVFMKTRLPWLIIVSATLLLGGCATQETFSVSFDRVVAELKELYPLHGQPWTLGPGRILKRADEPPVTTYPVITDRPMRRFPAYAGPQPLFGTVVKYDLNEAGGQFTIDLHTSWKFGGRESTIRALRLSENQTKIIIHSEQYSFLEGLLCPILPKESRGRDAEWERARLEEIRRKFRQLSPE